MLLGEVRRMPEVNRRVGVLDRLKELRSSVEWPLFVTFTSINKLGVNPSTRFATPLGIYAYPIDYVIDRRMDVPYAGDCEYIQVFGVAGDRVGWVLSSGLSELGRGLLGVLESKGVGVSGIGSDKDVWYAMYRYIKNLVVGVFNVVVYASEARKLLREAGIDYVVDNGLGIIHKNECTQVVFLNSTGLRRVDVIMNSVKGTIRGELEDLCRRGKSGSVDADTLFRQLITDDMTAPWFTDLILRYLPPACIPYMRWNHMRTWPELEYRLKKANKTELLDKIKNIRNRE